jgi:DNA-binding NtrC family response regulator|tara:strand:- start:1147 stop:1596 length:450 start_codon:yes stop_codon:yes gene_type:complete
MNVLIAEDNKKKSKQIMDFLVNSLNCKNENIVLVENKEDVIDILGEKDFSFLVLDMSLPRYRNDNDDIKHLAGKDVLIYMRHRRKFIPTIVITQHDVFGHHDSQISIDNLRLDLTENFSKFLVGVSGWDSSSEQWKDELSNAFEVCRKK